MNLTNVQRTKDYLGLVTTGSDGVIAQLIARASVQVVKWCSNPFQHVAYSLSPLDGTGSARMRVPNTPIISVSAVMVGGIAVAASPDGIVAGYQYDDKYLYLFGGYRFPTGFRNVPVSYVAGFTSSETDFIPIAPGPYTVTPTTDGYAIVDNGVTFVATGVALTLVGGVPITGQYSFANGVYTYAAADTTKAVTMAYDYAPGPVEQAVIEMVGGDLKQRDNLGIASKTLRDETVTYTDKAMSNSVQGLLWPYRKVVPI